MSDGPDEASVAVELSGEAGEGPGAGLVLEAERKPHARLDPDGIGVGADELAPHRRAAPGDHHSASWQPGRVRAERMRRVKTPLQPTRWASWRLVESAVAVCLCQPSSATVTPRWVAMTAAPAAPRVKW